MPSYLVSTDANAMGQIELNEDGELVHLTVSPVTPNPDDLPPESPVGLSTQWLVHHPTLPLVIVLTSYGNTQAAHLTCFQVLDRGALTKLPMEATTVGRQAVHAVFSPLHRESNAIALAVAHHNDGFVTFFAFSTQEMPAQLPDQPSFRLDLPELVLGTRTKLTKAATTGLSIPSSHHILYDPLGKYMWIVDPNQSAIFTYQCNPKTGLPLVGSNSKPKPTSIFKCHTDAPSLSWYGSIVGKMMGLSCRPRRIVLSPNGEFVFILYETRNVIQVYGVNPKTGEIDTASLQQVSTLHASLVHTPFVGLTLQSTTEMVVSHNALYVANRGHAIAGLGQRENSIGIFSIRDGGRLVGKAKSVVCNGPVRHFCVFANETGREILVAGTEPKPGGKSLQIFARNVDNSLKEDRPKEYKLVGEAELELDVICLLQNKSDVRPCREMAILPPTPRAFRATRGSIVKALEAKHLADDKKREYMADAIREMEEEAMNSFRRYDSDEGPPLLEPDSPEG